MDDGDILTLNAGSSSLKFAIFDSVAHPHLRGEVAGLGTTAPMFTAVDAAGALLARRNFGTARTTHEEALDVVLGWLERHRGRPLSAAGHRVVHGGAVYAGPVRVQGDVLARLTALVPLAPLHQPHNLAPIRTLAASRPALPQVACFDTSFHHGHDPVVDRFALPRALAAEGVRRYGFHGLSYEFIAGRLAELDHGLAAGRVVVAHLGAGSSLCAMSAGRSRDTTMGFTALDGVPMGTRCGALDPGVVLWLMQQKRMEADEIEDLLYRRSGLLGVSGLSADMKTLLASALPDAVEAVALYVFRIAREVAALTATLGGIDALMFTGGIGANAPAVRAGVCARLGWLGVTMNRVANEEGRMRFEANGAKVALFALPTDEERMVARHVIAVLAGAR